MYVYLVRNLVCHGYVLFVIEPLQPAKPTVCLLALWDLGAAETTETGGRLWRLVAVSPLEERVSREWGNKGPV